MLIEVVKSKIHRVSVTEANLDYVGSLAVDEDLIDAAGMFVNEKIQVVNCNNGERLETYLIAGERGSGVICLNGASARKAMVGDIILIIAYGTIPQEEAKSHKPKVIFPDTKTNSLK